MPPPLALLLGILFILYLFRRDFRQQINVSYGLWIPCVWLLILGSRAVSQWLQLGAPVISANAVAEGSPLDALVFTLLIVTGLIVLWRRHIRWTEVFRHNLWLTLFFVYCGVSLLWSDFPLVASKRWVKALGDPIMALIILTEPEPILAIETVIRRCYYVLVPLSIVFIKYYPDLGRTYDDWTGAVFFTGVNTNKNMLGLLCMVFGLFSIYRLCIDWPQKRHDPNKRADVLWIILLLYLNLWTLWMADSKTSLLSLILGAVVILATGYPIIRQRIGKFVVGSIFVYGVLEISLSISTSIITSSGRDATLTGRADLWEVLLKMDPSPILGHGFESFWLGDRLKKLWDLYYFKPTQAHNGYIEVYLNLGLIGLFLLAGVIFSCFNNIRKLLVNPGPKAAERLVFDRFRLAYLLGYVLYNMTEGGFRPLNFVFIIFLILSIEYPRKMNALATQRSSAHLSASHPKTAGVIG